MTPPAASSPKALPPVRSTACTSWIRVPGRSRSVSRVPGAPPRTSTPPTAPSSQRTTVQPGAARRFLQWPTLMPGTSVMASRRLATGFGGSGRLRRGSRERLAPGAEVGAAAGHLDAGDLAAADGAELAGAPEDLHPELVRPLVPRGVHVVPEAGAAVARGLHQDGADGPVQAPHLSVR